ncbi:MAG: hypothetical protein ACOCXS_02520 [Bacteroidota bacterium]
MIDNLTIDLLNPFMLFDNKEVSEGLEPHVLIENYGGKETGITVNTMEGIALT